MFWQDKDLKQYMDDCGNIMSMHNVKVSILVSFPTFSVVIEEFQIT